MKLQLLGICGQYTMYGGEDNGYFQLDLIDTDIKMMIINSKKLFMITYSHF